MISRASQTSVNTITVSTDFAWVVLRLYVPDPDPSLSGRSLMGGVPLPTISVTGNGGSQQLQPCSLINRLADVNAFRQILLPVHLSGAKARVLRPPVVCAPAVPPPALLPTQMANIWPCSRATNTSRGGHRSTWQGSGFPRHIQRLADFGAVARLPGRRLAVSVAVRGRRCGAVADGFLRNRSDNQRGWRLLHDRHIGRSAAPRLVTAQYQLDAVGRRTVSQVVSFATHATCAQFPLFRPTGCGFLRV